MLQVVARILSQYTLQENTYTNKQVWASTVSTFLSKFFFALTFLIPVLLLDLSTAVIVSLIWGVSILAFLSYLIAKAQQENPWKVISEHLGITAVVIAITHTAGSWISSSGLC